MFLKNITFSSSPTVFTTALHFQPTKFASSHPQLQTASTQPVGKQGSVRKKDYAFIAGQASAFLRIHAPQNNKLVTCCVP